MPLAGDGVNTITGIVVTNNAYLLFVLDKRYAGKKISGSDIEVYAYCYINVYQEPGYPLHGSVYLCVENNI